MQCMQGAHATRSSHEKGVCLSVCPFLHPSVKRVDCDKTEERSAQIFIHYERRMVGGGAPSTWNFESNWRRWSENANFEPIFAAPQP